MTWKKYKKHLQKFGEVQRMGSQVIFSKCPAGTPKWGCKFLLGTALKTPGKTINPFLAVDSWMRHEFRELSSGSCSHLSPVGGRSGSPRQRPARASPLIFALKVGGRVSLWGSKPGLELLGKNTQQWPAALQFREKPPRQSCPVWDGLCNQLRSRSDPKSSPCKKTVLLPVVFLDFLFQRSF